MKIRAIYSTLKGAATPPLWIEVQFRANPGEVYPCIGELLRAAITNILVRRGIAAGLSMTEAHFQATKMVTWEPATEADRIVVAGMGG